MEDSERGVRWRTLLLVGLFVLLAKRATGGAGGALGAFGRSMARRIDPETIRVTFDGKKPTPRHGLKLSAPEHFFPFAKQMKFASVEQGREAIVNFLWLKLSPKPRG